jgi:hypothetical protein
MPAHASDPRLCPFCGKLRDPFLEKCEQCESSDSYIPPEMRAPAVPEKNPRDYKPAFCPSCGKARGINSTRCPWCDSRLPPMPES